MPNYNESSNGAARHGPEEESGLAARLRKSAPVADRVLIGSKHYKPNKDHATASWAELRKIVASIRWLKRGLLPYGMLTGLIGPPKAGKSALALGGIARPIIRGTTWFNTLESPERGYVVWCDTERRAAVNLQRAEDWKIPLDGIKTPYLDDPLRIIDLNSREDIDRLYSVVCRYKAKLVVVDSFRGSHKGDENQSTIAESLQNLGRIAEATNAAILLIHHTRKLLPDEEMTADAGRGSNAFLAMVACQLAIDCPDPDSDWRRLQVLGENLGVAPQPTGFRITGTGIEFGDAPTRQHKETEKAEAADWLLERMKPGTDYDAADLEAEAAQCGYAVRTLRRAANKELGIKPKQKRKDNKIAGWTWTLPS